MKANQNKKKRKQNICVFFCIGNCGNIYFGVSSYGVFCVVGCADDGDDSDGLLSVVVDVLVVKVVKVVLLVFVFVFVVVVLVEVDGFSTFE